MWLFGYASVSATGSQVEVGVFVAGSGAKVLDPRGHYYINCRWENPIGTANALMVIAACWHFARPADARRTGPCLGQSRREATRWCR